ncbi:MAG TPA: regulatory protein RecX [Pseudomonadales bacterium]|nr:regulatory protein RecX [Pseudomonadales bacterium]
MAEVPVAEVPVTLAELRSAGIDYLARREHSRLELRRKLGKRFRGREIEEGLVDAAVEALAEAGLQSDERCAEAYIHARVSRGQGPMRVRAALREVGLSGEWVDLLLEAEEDQWPERLEALCQRRFGDAPPADRREWTRRARFLAGRGFPESLVVAVLGTPPGQ